jgi:hypothetical protein
MASVGTNNLETNLKCLTDYCEKFRKINSDQPEKKTKSESEVQQKFENTCASVGNKLVDFKTNIAWLICYFETLSNEKGPDRDKSQSAINSLKNIDATAEKFYNTLSKQKEDPFKMFLNSIEVLEKSYEMYLNFHLLDWTKEKNRINLEETIFNYTVHNTKQHISLKAYMTICQNSINNKFIIDDFLKKKFDADRNDLKSFLSHIIESLLIFLKYSIANLEKKEKSEMNKTLDEIKILMLPVKRKKINYLMVFFI